MGRGWRVGSLFSGIGGLDLGFERAGFEVVWFCEADGFCRKVLAKHWPGVVCYEDVRALHGLADAEHSGPSRTGREPQPEGALNGAVHAYAEEVDVLIGGFPCQDVSHAGKRAGLEGARSGLWSEFGRLIGELRPRVAVMENVPGLFTLGIDAVLGDLAALGYDAEWATLRASDVGAPHRRERVFIVAYPGGAGCAERVVQRSIRAGAKRADAGEAVDMGGRWPARPGEAQYEWEPPRVVASSRTQSPMGLLPSRLPPGLPRWRRSALQALGNSVVPQVAEIVARRVRDILEAQTS